MDDSNSKCARCQGSLRQSGLWGLCTKCLYDESMLAHQELRQTDAPVERKFSDYELVRPLGRGGMGVVYEAVQLSVGRRVAVKMILDADGASPAAVRRFMLEAETIARLDHPNIVPLYQVGEVNGHPFLSMKLIAGETLRKKIASAEFGVGTNSPALTREKLREKLETAVRLLVKVAAAVEHAHENEVLHRDLKPGNILVDGTGQPYLMDFGLAKMLESETDGNLSHPSGTPGTPSYMSPEQAEGKRLTAASDLYSLGAILYELLCGVPPFSAATPLETLRKVIEQQPIRPRTVNARIDKDLDTICLKCLEKVPGARYPTARDFAADLERWLRHEPIHARPAGASVRVSRWVLRNPVGTALIASLCLGLTVALVLLRQSLEQQRKLDLRRANSLLQVGAGIEEMWKDPKKSSFKISSPTLADIADLPPRLNDALYSRLTLGNTINHEPYGQAFHYANFLHELEVRLEDRLRHPFLVDLGLYKFESDAIGDLKQGILNIHRMPASAYIGARRKMPGLIALAREISHKQGVVFVGKNSGITNLAQLAGRRLVLGQASSDCAFWGKVHLARAGILSSDLRSCVHMGGRADDPAEPKSTPSMADADPNTQAHRRAVHEVVLGNADIGIAPRRQFELSRYRKQGLVELLSFPLSGEIYVASPEMPAAVVHALRDTLTSFHKQRDHEILARLAESGAPEGFEPVPEDELVRMERALEEELAAFERGTKLPLATVAGGQ